MVGKINTKCIGFTTAQRSVIKRKDLLCCMNSIIVSRIFHNVQAKCMFFSRIIAHNYSHFKDPTTPSMLITILASTPTDDNGLLLSN